MKGAIMDKVNGFEKSAIHKLAQMLYKKQALSLALTEAQLRASGNNCRSWLFKEVVRELLGEIELTDKTIRGIAAQQELNIVEQDKREEPMFVKDRR